MEFEIILAVAMFACAILSLLAGYSVALTLGGVALLFALIGIATGTFSASFLIAFPSRIQGSSIMQSQTLVAVPLFVLMGVILERSQVAEDLLHIASRLLAACSLHRHCRRHRHHHDADRPAHHAAAGL